MHNNIIIKFNELSNVYIMYIYVCGEGVVLVIAWPILFSIVV